MDDEWNLPLSVDEEEDQQQPSEQPEKEPETDKKTKIEVNLSEDGSVTAAAGSDGNEGRPATEQNRKGTAAARAAPPNPLPDWLIQKRAAKRAQYRERRRRQLRDRRRVAKIYENSKKNPQSPGSTLTKDQVGMMHAKRLAQEALDMPLPSARHALPRPLSKFPAPNQQRPGGFVKPYPYLSTTGRNGGSRDTRPQEPRYDRPAPSVTLYAVDPPVFGQRRPPLTRVGEHPQRTPLAPIQTLFGRRYAAPLVPPGYMTVRPDTIMTMREFFELQNQMMIANAKNGTHV